MRYYEIIYIVNTNYDSTTVDKCKEEVEKDDDLIYQLK